MREALAGLTAAVLEAALVNTELEAGRAELLAPLLVNSSRFLVSRFLSSGLSRKLSASSCSAISSKESVGIDCLLGGCEAARDFDGAFFVVKSDTALRIASFAFAFSPSCAFNCFIIVVFLTCRTFAGFGIGGF